jgi:hypothetical protein
MALAAVMRVVRSLSDSPLCDTSSFQDSRLFGLLQRLMRNTLRDLCSVLILPCEGRGQRGTLKTTCV